MVNRGTYPKKRHAPEGDHVLVYSTDPIPEKRCLGCSRTLSECVCSSAKIKSIGPINPVVRIEKKGRGGKIVTLLTRLPAHQTFLKELCGYLKKSVGSGGTHYLKDGEGVIEIQGDWRSELISLSKNYKP